ncbi:MAG: cytochrome c [Campylobacteraceae bacterium]|nr:cytochrome c [Campylobacteraceae bacterium]
MIKLKLTKYLLLISILFTSNAYSQETLCYKENLNSISDIEKVKLNGGECQNKNTIKDMQKKEWIINDIKITPKNGKYTFIYIFKKNLVTKNTLSAVDLDKKILEGILIDRQNTKKLNIKKEITQNFNDGKKLYILKCQRCHGEEANKVASNVSAKLSEMTYQEMEDAMVGYKFNDYDKGRAILMKPYSEISNKELKNVFDYIQTIKK